MDKVLSFIAGAVVGGFALFELLTGPCVDIALESGRALAVEVNIWDDPNNPGKFLIKPNFDDDNLALAKKGKTGLVLGYVDWLPGVPKFMEEVNCGN